MYWSRIEPLYEAEEFDGEGIFVYCPDCAEQQRFDDDGFNLLLMEACPKVAASTRALYDEFETTDRTGTWSYDGQSRLITFTTGDGRKSFAQFQMVGTWIEDSCSFLWSWANGKAPETNSAALQARDFGEAHGYDPLTHANLFVNRRDAWRMTKLTAYLAGLPMVYSVPIGHHVRAFMALERPMRAI